MPLLEGISDPALVRSIVARVRGPSAMILPSAAGQRLDASTGPGDTILRSGAHFLSWHAWAEVCIGGRWTPVDSTSRQIPADATNIRCRRLDPETIRALEAGAMLQLDPYQVGFFETGLPALVVFELQPFWGMSTSKKPGARDFRKLMEAAGDAKNAVRERDETIDAGGGVNLRRCVLGAEPKHTVLECVRDGKTLWRRILCRDRGSPLPKLELVTRAPHRAVGEYGHVVYLSDNEGLHLYADKDWNFLFYFHSW